MATNDGDFVEDTRASCTGSYTKPLTVAVEGNICSGKTTFLTYCKSKVNVEVIPEPIEKWTNFHDINLLVSTISNGSKYRKSKVLANISMVRGYRTKTFKPIRLIERSLLSARYCFMENMRLSGVLEPTMASVLGEYYDQADTDYRTRLHAIVYIRTAPEVAHGRMLDRARGEESAVSLEYITQLHHLHEEWISRVQQANLSGDADMSIFIINADLHLVQVCSQYEGCLQDINCLTM